MAKRSSLRIRLVLALLLMLTIVVFTSFSVMFSTLKRSMGGDQASFLARMYSDVRYPGDWDAREITEHSARRLGTAVELYVLYQGKQAGRNRVVMCHAST